MASKLSHHLFRAFFLFLVLQPFVIKSLKLELFQNLEKIQKGETVDGINQVKEYLKMYGYYPHDTKQAVLDDRFDEKLENALKAYQEYYTLNVTGKIDSNTIKAMATPRCGFPDIIPNPNSKTSLRTFQLELISNYTFTGGKWSKYDLTYNIQNATRGFTVSEMTPKIAQALQTWADVSLFKFTQAQGGNANINLGFFPKYHGDAAFRDITLAHAFPPKDGRLHFNEKWNWTLNKPTTNQIHLESVAVHELGHIIGLGHSNVRNAVMYPSYSPGTIKTDLDKDDSDGLKKLYGY